MQKLFPVPEVTTVNPPDLELESDTEEESPTEYRELDLPEIQNYSDDIELSDEDWSGSSLRIL